MMYTEMNSARQNLYYNKILRRAQNDKNKVIFTARNVEAGMICDFKQIQSWILWHKDSGKVTA